MHSLVNAVNVWLSCSALLAAPASCDSVMINFAGPGAWGGLLDGFDGSV